MTTHQPPIIPIIACTRYNNKTWQEYQSWKEQHQATYELVYKRPLKCIYGTPREISHKKIQPNAKILVIEMNNDENRIMGFGIIENRTASEVYRRPPASASASAITYSIFKDRNYNRYIYIGNEYYLSRDEIDRYSRYIETDKEQKEYKLQQILSTFIPTTTTITEQIQILEQRLFKGSRHAKRGSGITRVATVSTRPKISS